jgi:hypothetical protein
VTQGKWSGCRRWAIDAGMDSYRLASCRNEAQTVTSRFTHRRRTKCPTHQWLYKSVRNAQARASMIFVRAACSAGSRWEAWPVICPGHLR